MIDLEYEMRRDFWRATMYQEIEKHAIEHPIDGIGIEFGGSNGIIQGMYPHVSWEVREYPHFDIQVRESWNYCDMIIADQILEHVPYPRVAMDMIGEYTRQCAIITVPFLIGIHPCPGDYWRMTPDCIRMLAEPYFPRITIGTWGNAKINNWHAVYDQTCVLLEREPVEEVRAELFNNDPAKPFVIWAILEK